MTCPFPPFIASAVSISVRTERLLVAGRGWSRERGRPAFAAGMAADHIEVRVEQQQRVLPAVRPGPELLVE
jgi:hypothetical protein